MSVDGTLVVGNRALLNRFWEKFFNDDGDVGVVDEIVAEEYLNNDLIPGESPGREGLKQFVQSLRSAFPDLRFAVQQSVAEGDKVVTRWHVTAQHQGEFMGVAATGKSIAITGMAMHLVGRRQD